MIVRELGNDEKNRVLELSLLHKKAFPGFFLTQLGIPFLNTLYKGYLEDENSGILVAEEENRIVGLIAYSKDYPMFFKNLIKHKIVQFAWCSFIAFLRHPSFAKRLFMAFKKSDSVVKEEDYIELASICVDPAFEGRGTGSELIDYLKKMADHSKYAYISLETDAVGNDAVNKFYIKNGFSLERQYLSGEARKMNEYRFYLID